MRRLRSIIGGITTATALFAALQAQTGGTPLTLAATTIPATAGQLYSSAAPVTLTSAANLSAGKFTVVGTDRRGNALSEIIVGPNANTVSGHFLFATITSITPDTTNAGTVSAGVAGVHYGPWLVTAFHLAAPVLWQPVGTTTVDVMVSSTNFLDPGQFQSGASTDLNNGAWPMVPAALQSAAPWLLGTALVLPEDDGTWSGQLIAPVTFTSAAVGAGGNTTPELRLDPTGPFAWRLKVSAAGAGGLAQLDVNLIRPALS